jgi:hypothetical protein
VKRVANSAGPGWRIQRNAQVTGEEGRKSVELFNAIYRSNALRVPVTFPLATEVEPASAAAPSRVEV